MPLGLKTLDASISAIVEKVQDRQNARPHLWPEEYLREDGETAYRFVRICKTWNEATSETDSFPDLPHIEAYCHEWAECKSQGRTLVTEKCRRMVLSWTARALELWAMGVKRTDCILVGEDLEAAAKHVWRLKHIYTTLQKDFPAWNLPKHSQIVYEGERKLSMFGLANGSVCNYANGQAYSIQGEGTGIITMEEFCTYRYAPPMLAQAKIVTQAQAGRTGGFVNVITNASPAEGWQEVKKGILGKTHA